MRFLFRNDCFVPDLQEGMPDQLNRKHMIAAITDSHPVFIGGMALILNQICPDLKVIKSGSFEELGALEPLPDPDFILLGVNETFDKKEMKQFRLIRKKFPRGKVIIVYNQFTMLLPLLRLDVHGFLAKKDGMTELKECLLQILDNKMYVSNELFEWINRSKN